MKVYLKQPIEAEQFDGSSDLFMKYDMIDIGTMCEERHSPEIYMSGINKKVSVGDWIITDNFNHHTLMTDKEFQQQYAGLPVIPKNVAGYIVTGHGLNDLISIGGEIYRAMIQAVVYGYQKGDIGDWIINHSDMFARAWLDGYTVKADK
ncbi:MULTISPECIES: DUF1642 domain-containing protein [Lactiplantibacillus]|uniref:DUF1642 domain-containing protein n=1 Tax=Lactiplantibacillus TaxID=2767842 RepID=UPI00073AAE3F|nr:MULTISPECIES: DUF1642 domain-containing protein [Lactiplantibacillus]PNW62411.1 hypothetical protein ACZ99_13610 [Lactobacillus sp. ATCC 15578]ALV14374.1 hypothetical protein AD081_05965 [Lactiplantibacillus plantarum]AMR19290.1 hypothetical protein AZF39_01287 [Lactiplantibacillus plantarum]AYA96463.1 hypothetical protein CFM86_06230 [Lactiplantibacillus plantarum]AYG35212.1 hypothetical protein CFI98_10625 [Lactiplantibacillus plantarum]